MTFYSLTLRHDRLSVTNRVTVLTAETPHATEALDVSVAEARQLFSSKLTDIFDYLQPTPLVPTGGPSKEWARKFFPGDASLGEAMEALNSAILREVRIQVRYHRQRRRRWIRSGNRRPGSVRISAT